MVKLFEALLHPYETPGIGKTLGKIDPGSKKLDETVRKYLDPKMKKPVDPSASSYIDPFTGEIVNYRKGGKVKKYARGGGIEVKGKTKGKFYAGGGKVSDSAKNDKLAPDFLNQKPKAAAPKKPAPAPAPKKFARGGGVEIRGKTRGKFI